MPALVTLKSKKTFAEEDPSFEKIPGIFWESPNSYPSPFDGIAKRAQNLWAEEAEGDLDPLAAKAPPQPRNARQLEGTGLWYINRPNAAHTVTRVAENPKKTDAEFAATIWNQLGIDIKECLNRIASGRLGDIGTSRALIAEFGAEAFGCYCPWHAFRYGTPWGIYMHLERILFEAVRLYISGEFLPREKPSLVTVTRLLWWLFFRHELFHFHVERYAARLESALRRPVYRPYVDCVRSPVRNSPQWWEEALAQAVVL